MSQRRRGVRTLYERLPLVWKLLLPFLALELLIGYFGVILLAHDLRSRAQTTVDSDLGRAYFESSSLLHDSELSLVEATNLAANLTGMAAAVQQRDAASAAQLLRSVVALKPDLRLLAVTDHAGVGLAEDQRSAAGAPVTVGHGTPWQSIDAVRVVLAASSGLVKATFASVGGRPTLVIAAPICSGSAACHPVGAAIVGVPVGTLVEQARALSAGAPAAGRSSLPAIAIFDPQGRLLGASTGVWTRPPIAARHDLVRVSHGTDAHSKATAYGPLGLLGTTLGVAAIQIPTGPVFASARRAAVGLAILLVLGMVGTVVIGGLLARRLVLRIRRILGAVRAIGSGDRSARLPLVADDELTDLAQGVNLMAEEIEAGYQTLESRVAQRTEEIRRLLDARTEFFAGLTHDLRTPLAVLLAQADLLSAGGETNTRGARAGRAVRESSEQLLRLVNDILEVARAESGSVDVHPAPVALPDELARLQSTMRPLARAAGLSLTIDVPPTTPVVTADAERLRQVLLNLVHNAVKYTPKGGQVGVRAEARGGEVVVVVTDTGVGIPPEVGNTIFEPFRRVPGAAPVRGDASSGLGLAVARRYVEAMGGEIGYRSVLGKGSEFWFTLPVAVSDRGEQRVS